MGKCLVRLNVDLIVRMFTEGLHEGYIVEQVGALPDDARVVGAQLSHDASTVDLCLESPSWEVFAMAGGEWPVNVITMRSLESSIVQGRHGTGEAAVPEP